VKEEHKRAQLWKRLTELAHSKKLLGGYNREGSKEFIKLSKRNLLSVTKRPLEAKKHCRFCGNEKETLEHLLVNVMQLVATSSRMGRFLL